MKRPEKFFEGILSKLGISKPKPEQKFDNKIHPEEREMISKHFPSNNGNVKYSSKGDYVFPGNVHAKHSGESHTGGKIHLGVAFFKEKGKLKASAAHYGSHSALHDSRSSPIVHTEHDINSEEDLKSLKMGNLPESPKPKKSKWYKS